MNNNTNQTTVDIERPLGASEKMLYAMREYGGWNVSGIIQLSGSIQRDRLLGALKNVIIENPILNYTISLDTSTSDIKQKKKETVSFITDKSERIPFEEHIVNNEEDVTEFVENTLNTLIPSDKKLWRLALITLKSDPQSPYLVVTFDHCITDGQSCYKFFELLLNAYQNLESQEPEDQLFISKPIETSLNYRLGIKDIFYFLRHEFSKLFFPVTLNFAAKAPLSKRGMKLLKVSFTPDQTDKIVELSRKNNTSLQGTIVAALFFATAKHGDAKNNRFRFSCTTPVNMRKIAGISESLLGVYASAVGTTHNIGSNTSFWSMAQEIKQNIEQAKSDNLHLSSMYLFEFMQRALSDDFRMDFMEGKNMGRLFSSSVTNLGRIDLKQQYGDIRIKSFRFAVAQHGMGGSFTITPITYDGSLQFYIHYVSPLTSDEKAESVRECLISLLSHRLTEDFSLSDL